MTNILITGADGFIGSHLTEFIYKESKSEASHFFGAKIRALSQYNSFNYWGWLEDTKAVKSGDIKVLCGDIRDPHFCKNITKGVDIIFHLAALIAIPYSYIAPDSYLDTNAKG
ncbi:MAG: GDP-mannose 4,6-dehydratase, partial [Campylobacter sp.]|nr:GDP-mannose 4,6-dehydratase [Campylobacter sp.]